MNRRIVCWLALLVVASVATACAQGKVGTFSTALPFGPSVTANGMAGIGLAAHSESDFVLNPGFLGLFDRTASAGSFPVWARPFQVAFDPVCFAASGVVSPMKLFGRPASRLHFAAGLCHQELKDRLYEVTFEGTFLRETKIRTLQAALGASYDGFVDIGCGIAWRHFDYDGWASDYATHSYDFGAVMRLPLGPALPVERRQWDDSPYACVVGNIVWTGYGPDLGTRPWTYAQDRGRRYGVALEFAYRWLWLCPAIEREATPAYRSTITRIGGELGLADILSLRGGKIDYREQDYVGIDQVTFGFGISTHGLKRLVWSQAEAGATAPWWRRLDVQFSCALMCDADELVESTEFYELRLTY